MIGRLLAASVISLGVIGCAPRTVAVTVPFDAKQAAYIHTKGKATISGQAFLRRNDGIVVYAAGSDVSLTPATAYAEERMAGIFQGRKYLSGLAQLSFENEDPEYRSFKRIAKANGEGRFTFPEVASGPYFVVT